MKKDALKSSLIKKKPVIEEQAAQAVVDKIHEQPAAKPEAEEEPTMRTSIDFPVSLHKAMKIKLIQEGWKSMRDYLVHLVNEDLKA